MPRPEYVGESLSRDTRAASRGNERGSPHVRDVLDTGPIVMRPGSAVQGARKSLQPE